MARRGGFRRSAGPVDRPCCGTVHVGQVPVDQPGPEGRGNFDYVVDHGREHGFPLVGRSVQAQVNYLGPLARTRSELEVGGIFTNYGRIIGVRSVFIYRNCNDGPPGIVKGARKRCPNRASAKNDMSSPGDGNHAACLPCLRDPYVAFFARPVAKPVARIVYSQSNDQNFGQLGQSASSGLVKSSIP